MTLVGFVLGLALGVAILLSAVLIPARKRATLESIDRYVRWGKAMAYVLGGTVLVLGVTLGYMASVSATPIVEPTAACSECRPLTLLTAAASIGGALVLLSSNKASARRVLRWQERQAAADDEGETAVEAEAVESPPPPLPKAPGAASAAAEASKERTPAPQRPDPEVVPTLEEEPSEEGGSRCPGCEAAIDVGTVVCPSCGAELSWD